MRQIIIIFSIFLLLTSCNKKDNPTDLSYPMCIQSYIDVFLKNYSSPQTPRATIDKYIYYGKEVYVLNFQNFPDGQSSVISLQCEILCALGGIDGTQNDCQNWDDAKHIGTVWIDNR